MYKLIITALVTLFTLAGVSPAMASPSNPQDLPACTIEDGSSGPNPCYWHASKQGNGEGRDIINAGESVIYPSTNDRMDTVRDAQAWELFDAVNAVDLVQYSGNFKVELAAQNQTGFTPTSLDQIHVWDLSGNHYLFSVTPAE